VTDKKTGDPIPFEKVRDLVSQKLSGEKQKGVFDSYMAELKKTHKIEINKEALTTKPVPAKTDKQETPVKAEEKKAEPKKDEPKK
jgi:hypothetical protein